MDIHEYGWKMAKLLKFGCVKTEYKVLKVIGHDVVYREKLGEGMDLATNWFAKNM